MSRLNNPRTHVLIGLVLALALAATRFAPILAGPINWQP